MGLVLNVDFWFQQSGGRSVKRCRGDLITPDNDRQKNWLIKHGIVVDDSNSVNSITESLEGSPEPVDDVEEEPVAEPESEPEQATVKPLKSAAESTWRKYAKELGLDVVGLTKPQIIAAVSDFENKNK